MDIFGNIMKISHEVPLSLLDISLEWNDYQYILPHLINKYPMYEDFMRWYRRQDDSFIIMDNGLHEGIPFNQGDLLWNINLIEPNIFIVPDAWNDTLITVKNAAYWIKNLKEQVPEIVNLMVVLQGTTFSELILQFQACYSMGYRYFAINYSSSSYQIAFPNKNKLISQMMGRVKFIHEFNEMLNRWGYKDIYLHLLGTSLPQEFVYYKDYPIINSIDTSNPIIVGALGNRYNDYGLLYKPEQKIETFIEKDLESQYSNIKFNIYKFKSWINSEIIPESMIGS